MHRAKQTNSPAFLAAAADAVSGEFPVFSRDAPMFDRNFAALEAALHKLCGVLGTEWRALSHIVTDLISFGPGVYEDAFFHDTLRKAERLGLPGARCHTVDLGGASVAAGLELARDRIQRDPDALILLAGGDIPRSGYGGARDYGRLNAGVMHPVYEEPMGATLIGNYALAARRLLFEHGIRAEDLRRISRYYRSCVQDNPRAVHYGAPLASDDDKAFRKNLADPYSSPMIALLSDHGFACLIAGERAMNDLQSIGALPAAPLQILGAGGATHAEYFIRKGAGQSPAGLAGARAFADAGLVRDAVDFAWLYDCFTGMTVAQASHYFGLAPRDVVQTLQDGELHLPGGKRIPVNAGGGICNYQAAVNLSGAVGVMELAARFGLAADPMPGVGPAEAGAALSQSGVALLGGNGGIDTMNHVVLLGRGVAGGESEDVGVEENQSVNQFINPPVNNLALNDPRADDGDEAIVYSSTVIRFHPGRRSETPYALILAKTTAGQLVLARLADRTGRSIPDDGDLEYDRSRVRLEWRDGLLLARPIASKASSRN